MPFFRDAKLDRLERADVQQWIEKLSQRLAPSTLRRRYVILDQVLVIAMERGIIAQSPAKGVQLRRIVRTESRFLTPSELEQLAAAIEPRYRAKVLVMAWATLRIGEASRLRRSDINFNAGTIRIENNAVQVLGMTDRGAAENQSGSMVHDVAVLGS